MWPANIRKLGRIGAKPRFSFAGEYDLFLLNLDYEPQCILLGLEAWVFNDAWNKSCGDYSNFVDICYIKRNKSAMLKNIIKDWAEGKWTFESINNYPTNIGFNGRVKDNGFIFDGSYYYGDIYRHPEEQRDYLFADTLNRIENNIEVIGFLAPFAPTIYNVMEALEASGNYGYIIEDMVANKSVICKYVDIIEERG